MPGHLEVTMKPDPESEPATAERRRSERQAAESRLDLVVETDRIVGVADNLSEVGVLFYSDQPLRVRVELQDGGTRRGRLVRIQRTSGSSVGFAVEFDRD